MQTLLTGKIGEGWQGYISIDKSLICFGAYINSKGNLITPTLYYSIKNNEVDINEVKATILKMKPDLNISDFINSAPLYDVQILMID